MATKQPARKRQTQSKRQPQSKHQPAPRPAKSSSRPKKKPIRSSRKATARTERNQASSSSTAKPYPTFERASYFVKMKINGFKDPNTPSIICDLVKIFNACLQQLNVPIQVEKVEVRTGFADED